ncbi:ATP-binding protein [Aetokthonos hydrillicola Thurmond2011]|uniref:histidine kinase n=2 Tax=Aetokthonos TaxID=1550243 RepID=A0AAP5ICV7_9CYAN|nr:ATP-binding protein [Aetokthonos hydrillicola]MBO3460697.1 hybrid sensor histidine kinase/response regulator [Aetokthonos hydrillicola CCALA 1050]MBW4587694.1 hybrid sensor histidine kinase/response regulator [Aetokthonos hydrillicola CCALA 1050]MDR9897924.1 ATP-binding protein [Aetokthonos hydrillicola Thurmond2011]
MLKYPLYDLIATVPSCLETTALAVVLEIFAEQQCDRVVILDEQQCPIGLLYCARLASQMLNGQVDKNLLDLQQPVSNLGKELIQPIQTLPASFCVEQLSRFLHSQPNQANTSIGDWVLIDSNGKLLGLLDSVRLLQIVAKHKGEIVCSKSDCYPAFDPKLTEASIETNHTKSTKSKPLIDKPLVQLLERLPWPLMLQTSAGEIVTQNPAWWQQLGSLKDPEGVRQQVEAILGNTQPKKTQHPVEKGVKITTNSRLSENYSPAAPQSLKLQTQENSLSGLGEELSLNTVPKRSKSTSPKSQHQQQLEATGSSRCFLDSQLGTCTCIVEVQNGQERVWQFAKIPLDSPDWQILTRDSEGLLGDPNYLNAFDPSTGKVAQYSSSSQSKDLPLDSDLWLMLATDVTEQQQLCKELAAKNADLIQLNRLKDEFLACISHELKTPLTAVLGLSRLLVDQQLGTLNERQARYAGLIHQSGRHLMSVVNDILDLTRMETGQMELSVSNVKIRSVCDRAISEAKTIHRETSKAAHSSTTQEHQFTISIEPGLDELVADEFRLRQMLVNLLSNAFKFTETGGEIGLLVNRWEGWITFTVWDTGIGIPEHQQHLIFQKFQQLENPLTRQHEGTGLGLVLTRALARLHGGDVSFLSKEGKGSQFSLLLPPSPPQKRTGDIEIWGSEQKLHETSQPLFKRTGVQQTQRHSNTTYLNQGDANNSENLITDQLSIDEPKNYSPHLSPSLSSQHPINNSTFPTYQNSLILVVEAVARYIDDLTKQLTGLGYRVVIARSGCEALEKARRLQPKAIFLNPLLPLLSGWDVLTLLKSDSATRHIPVVVTATRAEKEQAHSNRADGFLSLPVQHQFLTPLIENLFAIPEAQPQKRNNSEIVPTQSSLRILRLVSSESEYVHSPLSLQNHRVVEADNLDQADLLTRVWHFDVVLLDAEMPAAQSYLQKFNQYPRLITLPLVTCDVATTQAASLVPGLSVFPCLLTSFGSEHRNGNRKTDALLSVLQIAAGVSCPPSILVVDFAMLPDLPEIKQKPRSGYRSQKHSPPNRLATQMNTPCASLGLKPLTISRGSEWFQALIQYLLTAGLKAVMGRSWAELLQQIRHGSADLLLICLGESNSRQQEVYSALQTLRQLPFNLPPVLVLDQRLNSNEAEETQDNNIETVLGTLTNHILPRSISMEDLLTHIHQALNANG